VYGRRTLEAYLQLVTGAVCSGVTCCSRPPQSQIRTAPSLDPPTTSPPTRERERERERETERERERERESVCVCVCVWHRVLCVLEEWFVLCRCPFQRSSVHVLACRTERGADRLKTGTNQSPYWCARAQVPDPHLSSTSRCQRQSPTGAEVKRTGIATRPFCSAVCSSIQARNNHATL
jgi:hypothetical protein